MTVQLNPCKMVTVQGNQLYKQPLSSTISSTSLQVTATDFQPLVIGANVCTVEHIDL